MAVVACAAAALLATTAPALGAGETQAALSSWAAANPTTTALVWRLDDAGGGVRVAGIRAESPGIPASTMKLVTGAGALLELGADFRFRTRLLAGPRSGPVDGVLTGPLYIQGAGDPVLSTRAYADRHLARRFTSLGLLAAPLRGAGVRTVRGPIVADEHLFDSRRTVPSWPSYYSAYVSPLSALATNQDFAGNGRGSHVTSPPLAAARRLRAALTGRGITQSGPLRTGVAPPTATPIATVESPPLPTILRAMNLDSDNFIAETLTKGVGAYGTGRGTTAAGVAQTRAALIGLDILTPADRLADGSGLSRDSRLSAASLVRLMAAADANPSWGAPLLASLPRGGEGTLVRRLLSGPARSRVRAKTGYLNGVSTIAGRVVSRGGFRYAFAMLMATGDITGARTTQDRVIDLLASGAEDPAA